MRYLHVIATDPDLIYRGITQYLGSELATAINGTQQHDSMTTANNNNKMQFFGLQLIDYHYVSIRYTNNNNENTFVSVHFF